MGENAGESLETAGWEARQKRQAKDEVDLWRRRLDLAFDVDFCEGRNLRSLKYLGLKTLATKEAEAIISLFK